jgi:two-component system, chemotaxis family, protein-glutamate methylesterase/glutaminase
LSKIKVLVVDDSAVVRQVVTGLLKEDAGIEVLGAVSDPLFAIERMKRQQPDVIVLDVEMPRMDGITFLKKLMAERPTPVVICSTLTEAGAATTIEALAAGAVSIVTKPKAGMKQFLEEAASDLLRAIKAAARANVKLLKPAIAARPLNVAPKLTADAVLRPPGPTAMKETTERVVAIGTSTGGTQALEHILTNLPRVCPGIAIVQHMPEKFTAAFAERLNQLSDLDVREATHGERLLPGCARIAPGGKHMMLRRSGAYYYTDVVDGPLVSRHKPSVDVLFRSVARSAGKNACGIIMTGMGDDGARGMKEMHDAGAFTVAQDKDSCVVFGMPKEAIELEAVDEIAALSELPTIIQRARPARR